MNTEGAVALNGNLIFPGDAGGGSGSELYGVPRIQHEGLQITKTNDAVSGASPGEEVTFTITVSNLGPSPVSDIVLRDILSGPASAQSTGYAPGAITGGASAPLFSNQGGGTSAAAVALLGGSELRIWIADMPVGSSVTFVTHWVFSTAGNYWNTVSMDGESGTATSSVFVEKSEAVKLTSVAGATSTGTVVHTTDITGETVQAPDGGCSDPHVGGTITILGDGPHSDPDPTGCSWGPALGLPDLCNVDCVVIPGLRDFPNTTIVYECGAGFLCMDQNGATLSADPGSADHYPSLFGATATIDSILLGGGNDNDNLTINASSGSPVTSGGFPGRLIVGAAGDDVIDCTNLPCIMAGDAGDDDLNGSPSRDILFGGSGNDALGGADGDDDYIFGPADAVEIDVVEEIVAGGVDTLNFTLLPNDDPVTIDLMATTTIATHTNRTLNTNASNQGVFYESVFGGDGDDDFTVDFIVATRSIDGWGGTDTLTIDAGGGAASDSPSGAGAGTVTGPGGSITYVNVENVSIINTSTPAPTSTPTPTPTPVPAATATPTPTPTPAPVPSVSQGGMFGLAIIMAALVSIVLLRRRAFGSSARHPGS